MNTGISRSAFGALVFFLLALSGCGGGGSATVITFTLLSVNPNTSTDLNGGDRVTITGTDFDDFVGFTVRFGGAVAINPIAVSDSAIEVTTPRQNNPGLFGIEVTGVDGDGELVIKQLLGAYTYVGAPSNPLPQTITPTTFTATGAEPFTITGASLGSPGGTVQVTFDGIGTVTGTVSNDATIVTGAAPITALTFPINNIQVSIDTGAGTGNVPTQVGYTHIGPQAFPVLFQNQGGASQPVRITDGFAVMCTAGANGGWGNADDDVFILQLGPGNSPVAVPVNIPGGGPVGFLDRRNSVPVVLDANTVCIYSVGPDGIPDPFGAIAPDDRVVLITSAQSATPVVTFHPAPFLNTAPLVRVADNAVAFMTAGPDTTRGTPDDSLMVYQFNGTALGLTVGTASIGPVDTTAGIGNLSLPFTEDGDAIWFVSLGADGTPFTGDDNLRRFTRSTAQVSTAVAVPNLAARPVALSATLVAAPSFGNNGASGGGDDQLLVVTDNAGVLNLAGSPLGQPLDAAALAAIARVGADKVAVPVTGPDLAPRSGDERILIYTDVANGTSIGLPVPGISILSTLGSGELLVFGPGTNLFPNDGDETVTRVEGSGVNSQNFLTVPLWPAAFIPTTDQDRAFAVSNPDAGVSTGDEQLVVFQTRALGAFTDAVTLALAVPNVAPLTAIDQFIPVGPNWGVIQSPGFDRVFGTNDDQIIFAHY